MQFSEFRTWLLRTIAAALIVWLLGCGHEDAPTSERTAGWPHYGGDEGGSRHSSLDQITPENVDQLEVAWTYHTGDVRDATEHLAPSTFQTTPILLGETLYFCTPFNRVIALGAETGQEVWIHDPETDLEGVYMLNCRGVSAWTDSRSQPGDHCATRIFSGTVDARLIALDAATGTPCLEFGAAGIVDLRAGVGDPRPGEYGVTSPPVVIGDRLITGSMVLDNQRVDAPSGVVRAYSTRSGALLWAWNALNPGEKTNEGGDYRLGTTNAWSALSVDSERNLVFVPTGNTQPDYYGGDRDGLDAYSSSIVALDADSGEPVWHFQTVHHDIWDYDIGAQPVLLEFPRGGGTVPGVVAATKMGHLFVLDRVSGEPLLPVEERAVPGDAVPGDFASPTQPFPIRPPPLHPATLTPEDAFGFTPWDTKACREFIESARFEGIFTPPSTRGTIQYPGNLGGMNWGSVSIDAARRLLVVNTTRIANHIRLVPRDEFETIDPLACDKPRCGYAPMKDSPYALEEFAMLSPFLGTPCTPPPWGTLVAIDLASGDLAWEIPLGNTRNLAPWPVWWLLGDIGVPNIGGPITTASGLLFIGATTDGYLRAFETETGEELWKARLPASAHATPMTYRVRPDGRQFVVIAAGGHSFMGGEVGDTLIAFALGE